MWVFFPLSASEFCDIYVYIPPYFKVVFVQLFLFFRCKYLLAIQCLSELLNLLEVVPEEDFSY